MKKAKLILFLCSLGATMYLDSAAIEFTDALVDVKRQLCEQTIHKYYNDYGLLLGRKIYDDSGKLKDEKIRQIIENYFRDSTIAIESDDKNLHKPNYTCNIYHRNIRETYENFNGSVAFDIKSISNVYRHNNNDNSYVIKATVEKRLKPNNENEKNNIDLEASKRTVDIYFNFYPEENSVKIFDIRNHTEDIPPGLVPVEVKNINTVQDELRAKKSYLFMDITPRDASISIDGNEVHNANGQYIEVERGSHQVSIQSEHYQPEVIDVDINKREKHTITRTLSLKTGYLNVSVNDPADKGASVLINNIEVGTVPLSAYPLAEGDYKLTVQKDTWRKNSRITIAENRDTKINVEHNRNNYLYVFTDYSYVYPPIAPVLIPNYYFFAPDLHTYRGVPNPTSNYIQARSGRYYAQPTQYRVNTIQPRSSNPVPAGNYGPANQPRHRTPSQRQSPYMQTPSQQGGAAAPTNNYTRRTRRNQQRPMPQQNTNVPSGTPQRMPATRNRPSLMQRVIPRSTSKPVAKPAQVYKKK